MKILFITRLFYPHVGGVEKHVYELGKDLTVKGENVTILTEKYDKKLKDFETIHGMEVVRFSYPHIRFLGLIFIWLQIFRRQKLIKEADIIHIHDVFIWYLPFHILFPNKKVFSTFHGWEQKLPIPMLNIIQRKLASKLSMGTISVGKYVEKYYGIKANKIIYGAADKVLNIKMIVQKEKFNVVFVGRLSKDTGLLSFLDWLDQNKKYNVDFCGGGPFQKKCEKYGTVHGFTDPAPYYKKAEYCVPGGYLAALEALSYGCKLKLFWNNKVKEDYWKMSPFYKLKGESLKKWAKKQTWDKLADEYLDLYNHTK